MPTKRIFNKKKSNKKKLYIIFVFLIFFIFFIFSLFSNKNYNFIIVPENNKNFYIIPEDKGGEKVKNLDKKSLNLKSEKIYEKNFNKQEEIYFSIQFYASDELEKITKYLDQLTNSDVSIYEAKNFFIMALNTEIGTDYFLLYRNFYTRDSAKKYCVKFLNKLNKCKIIDTTKF